LNKFEAGNIYLIQDCVLDVRCKITKANGSLPEKAKNVAPNNNVLHTLFEAVRVTINEKQITQFSSFYHLKTYISQTLTYPTTVKNSILESAGYYADIPGFFNSTNVDINTGFGRRNQLFRTLNKKGNDYKDDGTRFFGKLNLDLVSVETGLPPGTKIAISLDRAPDSFVLKREADDTENYKLQFLECTLYCPVAQLELQVYNQISSYYSEKSVVLHYRRTEIREVSLPKDKSDYGSDRLFTDDIPCRIVVWYMLNICSYSYRV